MQYPTATVATAGVIAMQPTGKATQSEVDGQGRHYLGHTGQDVVNPLSQSESVPDSRNPPSAPLKLDALTEWVTPDEAETEAALIEILRKSAGPRSRIRTAPHVVFTTRATAFCTTARSMNLAQPRGDRTVCETVRQSAL